MTLNPLDAMYRTIIGTRALQDFAYTAHSNYPPHNIEQISEDHVRLIVAVAGFARENIQISFLNGMITIQGELPLEDAERDYVYHGLALRNFTRVFKIGENLKITSASLSNGLLVIDLEHVLPESQRPILIQIAE